jgi:hypothetical protein
MQHKAGKWQRMMRRMRQTARAFHQPAGCSALNEQTLHHNLLFDVIISIV